MATVGSFIIALSILVFLINAVRSYRRGVVAGPDPWDGRTLEWTTSSPPADFNFAEVPMVEAIDDFWYKKYGEDDDHLPVRLDTNPLDPSALAPDEDHLSRLQELPTIVHRFPAAIKALGWRCR